MYIPVLCKSLNLGTLISFPNCPGQTLFEQRKTYIYSSNISSWIAEPLFTLQTFDLEKVPGHKTEGRLGQTSHDESQNPDRKSTEVHCVVWNFPVLGGLIGDINVWFPLSLYAVWHTFNRRHITYRVWENKSQSIHWGVVVACQLRNQCL